MSEPTGPDWYVPPTEPPAPRRSGALALAVLGTAIVLIGVVAAHALSTGGGLGRFTGTSSAVVLSKDPGELSGVLDATTASLNSYWTAELPKVYGQQFSDLKGGFQPKTPDSPPWTCNGQRIPYDGIQGNAFYCGGADDDYIAYDAALLLPKLDQEFGGLAPAVVLAHEMGHAIQARAGVDAESVVVELQADCFAGAWAGYAESSSEDPITVEKSALDGAVLAILALRDQPGTAATNPQAHGLAFDRVNAFQTGYEKGADECRTFPEGNVVITELPFSTPSEAQSGGNISFAEAIPFLTRQLDSFWAGALSDVAGGATYRPPAQDAVQEAPLAACPGDSGYDSQAVAAYCVTSNTVSYATTSLAQLHQQIGDLATGTALSQSWARAVQAQADLATTGVDAELQEVCFTGAWVSSIASNDTADIALSPGDIDEMLFTVLTPLSPSRADEVLGSAFVRADALRAGLLDGLGACLQ